MIEGEVKFTVDSGMAFDIDTENLLEFGNSTENSSAEGVRELSKDERDDLVLNNIGLVKKLANKFSKAGYRMCDFEELEGVGNLQLVESSLQYNTSMNVPFSSYAYTRIKYAMMKYISSNLTSLSLSERDMRRLNKELMEQKKNGEEASALDNLIPQSMNTEVEVVIPIEDSGFEDFEEEENYADIIFLSQKILKDNPIGFYVFLRHTGLYDGKEWTYQEISNELDKTVEQVRCIYGKAIKSIRASWKAYCPYGFFDEVKRITKAK